MYKVSVLVVLFLFAGCSSKDLYDNIQFKNRHECSKVPPPEYEECIEGASKSYEEYERERKETLGK